MHSETVVIIFNKCPGKPTGEQKQKVSDPRLSSFNSVSDHDLGYYKHQEQEECLDLFSKQGRRLVDINHSFHDYNILKLKYLVSLRPCFIVQN